MKWMFFFFQEEMLELGGKWHRRMRNRIAVYVFVLSRHRIRNNVTPFELKQRKQMPYTEFSMNIRKQSGESIVRRSRNRIKNCFQQQIGMRQTPSDRVRACSNLVPNRIVTRFTSGRSRFYGCEFTRSGTRNTLHFTNALPVITPYWNTSQVKNSC